MNKLTTVTRIAATLAAGFILFSGTTAIAKDGPGNGAGHAFGLSAGSKPPGGPTGPGNSAAPPPPRPAQSPVTPPTGSQTPKR
jgi:hypothetical protein